MKNLNQTAEELFSKIRGRYPGVTIGDDEGNVTQDPQLARFFEFPFREGESKKISISLSEEGGIVIMHNKSVAEDDVSKSNWYEFLKEMRGFAKKRMLNFEVRDITKSNLEKRDYKYLAQKAKDTNMNESKLYGTSKMSYQNIDNARLVIKHTESVNTELASGRTQKIGKIYIESAEGERFKYPYKHLSGARAMARHVSEGGVPFDEFGKHITGLSEELAKLRKFKIYMGRSSVMAESLSEYMDIVRERIQTVKKTVEHLQRPNYYREAVDSFETPVFEEVPDDVKENWIDELTIKQFNEELADVFPYIYNLIKEGRKAKELGPDDLVDEAGKMKGGGDDPCWKGYKMVGTKKKGGKEVPNCVPRESMELESAFEDMMGQFSEEDDDGAKKSDVPAALRKAKGDKDWKMSTKDLEKEKERNISSSEWLKKHKVESDEDDPPFEPDAEPSFDKDEYGNTIKHKARHLAKKGMRGVNKSADDKLPLGEFILSYFDRENGQFPKGETAVLTMVEKDYGEEFIEPAKAFMERVNNLVAEKYGYKETEDDVQLNRIKGLAGI